MLSRKQIVLASLGILTALTILAVVGFALWHTEQLRVKPRITVLLPLGRRNGSDLSFPDKRRP